MRKKTIIGAVIIGSAIGILGRIGYEMNNYDPLNLSEEVDQDKVTIICKRPYGNSMNANVYLLNNNSEILLGVDTVRDPLCKVNAEKYSLKVPFFELIERGYDVNLKKKNIDDKNNLEDHSKKRMRPRLGSLSEMLALN